MAFKFPFPGGAFDPRNIAALQGATAPAPAAALAPMPAALPQPSATTGGAPRPAAPAVDPLVDVLSKNIYGIGYQQGYSQDPATGDYVPDPTKNIPNNDPRIAQVAQMIRSTMGPNYVPDAATLAKINTLSQQQYRSSQGSLRAGNTPATIFKLISSTDPALGQGYAKFAATPEGAQLAQQGQQALDYKEPSGAKSGLLEAIKGIGIGIGLPAAGGAALGAFGAGAGAAAAPELAGAASDAGLATAANASAAQGGLTAVGSVPAAALPEVAAGAGEALPGAASDAGLQTAANASAQGLPAAAAPAAALPEAAPTPSTPPAASPAEAAPGPPAGTAPTAPTAPVTPTPTPTPGLPDPPTLGQAAQVASGAASAKTLLSGSGVTDEQLLTGQAPEAGGNQAGDVSTGFSGQGAGPDGTGVPTGLPSVDAPGSGLPGLPNNASDLLKLAPAIGGLAGLATSSSNANKYFDEIKALGGPQRDIANQLLAQYKSGTLNAADSFKIQQTKQAAINRANDFYAKAGIPDSTQLQGTLHDIDVQADAQTEQARQNLLTQGLNELNVTDQTQVEAIKAQIAGDQAAAKALTDFMTMLGTLGAKLPATQSGVATTK